MENLRGKENSPDVFLAEYNKKVASIDLELALTQNLYNTLLQAKANIKQAQPPKKSPEVEKSIK